MEARTCTHGHKAVPYGGTYFIWVRGPSNCCVSCAWLCSQSILLQQHQQQQWHESGTGGIQLDCHELGCSISITSRTLRRASATPLATLTPHTHFRLYTSGPTLSLQCHDELLQPRPIVLIRFSPPVSACPGCSSPRSQSAHACSCACACGRKSRRGGTGGTDRG